MDKLRGSLRKEFMGLLITRLAMASASMARPKELAAAALVYMVGRLMQLVDPMAFGVRPKALVRASGISAAAPVLSQPEITIMASPWWA